MASSCCAVYFFSLNWNEYLEFSVTTEVRSIDAEILEFPAVIVCDKNKLAAEISGDLLSRIVKQFDDIDAANVFVNLTELNKFKERLQYSPAALFFYNLEMEERKKLAKPIEKMLLRCRFNFEPCNFSDFEWFFNAEYGNCYRFNGDINVKKVSFFLIKINK